MSTDEPSEPNSRQRAKLSLWHFHDWLLRHIHRGWIPADALTIILAGVIGVLGGYGAVLFTYLLHFFTSWAVHPFVALGSENGAWLILLCFVPAAGLLFVSWFTLKFAPEAMGHGVPEVITSVARHDGLIRGRVAAVKILASGICIGTGGSVGREGPIVQIGSALGSMAGQFFRLSARNMKVLVGAGTAAGISATFNAPLAGVIFASEIILGSFAVESLTPLVIASVLADVVQTHWGEHGLQHAFPEVFYEYVGAWEELPSYLLIGLLCGLASVAFTKMLYAIEDVSQRLLPKWWVRSLVLGGIVGIVGVGYFALPKPLSTVHAGTADEVERHSPELFGVGYRVVDRAVHLERAENRPGERTGTRPQQKLVWLDSPGMLTELLWLLPLIVLKPLLTSLTLAGGGSGGIFAPSLFIGASLGASFGLACNLLVPEWSASPGVYAIVGMGAVVAGTTHGVLSAILIVYEMTGDYHIILPIMATAGLSSIVARLIDPESIYHKKLSRRGELIARGHDMHRLEHVMVRDVMIRDFPTVRNTDHVTEIVRTARANSHIESLPVMNEQGDLVGIIRPEDLHRVLDSDISPSLLNAEDIALALPVSVAPNENLLEALRDFGTRDVETLPVELRRGKSRRLVGLLLRSDVMRRYREEMLKRR